MPGAKCDQKQGDAEKGNTRAILRPREWWDISFN